MKNLEERLEYAPVGPARKAFKYVGQHFESDEELAIAMHRSLNEADTKSPIAYYTVRSSFQDHRQQKMQKRISDLILGWSRQLSREGQLDAPNFMIHSRNEVQIISREIKAMVEPLMDWYQFVTRKKLAQFIAQEYSFGQQTSPYPFIWSIFAGAKYKALTPPIERLEIAMVDMLRKAERHEPVKVQPHYVHVQRDSRIAESLSDFTERVISTLLEGRVEECRQYVKSSMTRFKRVQQLVDLVNKFTQPYQFASRKSAYDFSFQLMNVDEPENAAHYRHGQRDNVGIGRPTNVHRKLYTVALILAFAKANGLSAKVGPAYLKASRKQYGDEINHFERHGIPMAAYEELLSSIIGLSKGGARFYSQQQRDSMPYDKFMELREAISRKLPHIFVVDLTNGEGREAEYKRFMSNYRGGKVLVKTRRRLDQVDIKMLKEIRDITYDRGLPYLYPRPQQQIPEIAGYLHHKELFRKPY